MKRFRFVRAPPGRTTGKAPSESHLILDGPWAMAKDNRAEGHAYGVMNSVLYSEVFFYTLKAYF